ncbi:MAG: chalcone isomerase family protein [Thiomicrorhabdus sp.]|jgi:hypothetical protein|nr:chalcone isomerase family protein [Thiomicrorhabdus sp.]
MIRRFKFLKNPGITRSGGFYSSLSVSLLFSLLLSAPASAMEEIVDKVSVLHQTPKIEWQKVSTGTATWMWLEIYEATLYATDATLPKNFLSDEVPLKLSLCYLKPIRADIFIEGANEVLPKELTPLLRADVNRLHQVYQSVESGDCYTLEYTTHQGTALKLNGKSVFHSNQAGFKAIYFGIWLGNNPLSEVLKNRLLAIKFTSK